ncbi:TadE family type IV pilus minor pilin [Leucobacter sp. W1153]|uniref:TadE family type IV pilus minor pilin n=1 Tax=Leucobacter sp. W1153 TaxID=3439064 RepID=UPI003F3B5C94
MTAEFAVVLPAALIVLVLIIGSILLAAQQLTLTSAAGDVARLEARGDSATAAVRLSQLLPGVTVNVTRQVRGSLHCVALSAQPAVGLLSALQISASGCAARSAEGPAEISDTRRDVR